MSFKQANGGKVNPKYTGKRDGYSGNCQTCVAVFEARLRGYDMQAILLIRKQEQLLICYKVMLNDHQNVKNG